MTNEAVRPMRAEVAVAPAGRARRSAAGRMRALAVVLLAGAAAAASSLGWFAWRHRLAPAVRDRSPFPLDQNVWNSIRTVAREPRVPCTPPVPVAALYVSRSCTHCEAELRRWAAMIRSGAPEFNCVAVAVVAPYADRSGDEWLPGELSQSLLWDRDGTVARALDARLVPLAAFVTSAGVVHARAVGESSESATLERLRSLSWFATIERGGRWNEARIHQ